VHQQPSCSSEKAKHRDDVHGKERLQAKSPIVTGGTVDKEKRIAITPTVTQSPNAISMCMALR
jgi:hypothetical protein